MKSQEEIMQEVLAELALEQRANEEKFYHGKKPTAEESEQRLKAKWEKRQTPVKRAVLYLARFFKINKINKVSLVVKLLGIK